MKTLRFIYAILACVVLLTAPLAGVDLGEAGTTATATGGGEWG